MGGGPGAAGAALGPGRRGERSAEAALQTAVCGVRATPARASPALAQSAGRSQRVPAGIPKGDGNSYPGARGRWRRPQRPETVSPLLDTYIPFPFFFFENL